MTLLVVLACGTVLLLWSHWSARGTVYQGKSIRDWAAVLYASYEPRGTNAAAMAFQTLGSNAVPELRPLATVREPIYEKSFLKHARKLPAKLSSYLFQKLQPGRALEIRIGALRALGVIGPDAHAALPEMLTALADSDSRVRWTAAQTITLLGPEAVAALLPLTTNADVNLRHAAVYSLGEARTNALPATVPLIHCTLDTNESVRASAYYSLSRIGSIALPQIVAMADTNADPILRNAAFRSLLAVTPPPGRVLSSSLMISTNNAEIRQLAVLSLSRTRLTNAHAMNLFTNALSDEAEIVREAAQLALKRITTGKLR